MLVGQEHDDHAPWHGSIALAYLLREQERNSQLRAHRQTAVIGQYGPNNSYGVMDVIVKDEICISDVPGKRDYIQ